MSSLRIGDMPRHALLAVVFLLGLGSLSFAQSNCTAADPNDNQPDDAALNACLSTGGTVTVVHGSPGYIIEQKLQITRPGTTLIGVDGGLADFVASPNITGQMILVDGVNNVTLQNLWLNGNKDNRSAGSCDAGNTGTGKNITAVGDYLRIDNVGSVNTLCASAAEVQGTGIEISNSFFAWGGREWQQGGPPIADGLTVGRASTGRFTTTSFRTILTLT